MPKSEDGWDELDLNELEIEFNDADPSKTKVSIKDDEDEEIPQKVSDEVEVGDDEEDNPRRPSRAEKRIKELTRQRYEAQEAAAALRNDLMALKQELSEVRNYQQTSEQATVEGLKKSIASEIAAAEEAWADAIDNGEGDKAKELMRRIRKAEADLNKVNSYQPNRGQQAQPGAQQKQTQQQSMHPRVNEWIKEHPEILVDDDLRVETAKAARLLESQGYTPDDDEYYELIEQRLERKFPDEFGSKGGSRKNPVRGRNNKGGGSKNKVSLTAREQALAKQFGMSNEQFAKEKLKVQQADEDGDGYVTIA